MTIHVNKLAKIEWNFYRKGYRKARWRRLGQRLLNRMQEEFPGYDTLIVVL